MRARRVVIQLVNSVSSGLLLVLVLLLVGTQQDVFAVEIMFRPYLGYGYGMAKQSVGTDYIFDSSHSPSTLKDKIIRYSAGEGIQTGLGVDIGFKDNFSLETVFGYSSGPEQKVFKVDINNLPSNSSLSSAKMSTSFIPLSITAKFKIKGKKFTPYIGIGPTFVFNAKSVQKSRSENRMTDTVTESELETVYHKQLGFHGIVGTDYKVSPRFSLFIQARVDQLSLKPDRGELTKYVVNGVDKLNTLVVHDREVLYKDDVGGDIPAADKPSVLYAKPMAASSLGIQLGVAYKF